MGEVHGKLAIPEENCAEKWKFYDWENFRKNYKQTHSQQKIAGASVTVKSLELKNSRAN